MLLLILPATAVVLLGMQLLAQDRQLAATQQRDRQQVVADRVAGELEKIVVGIERQLATTDLGKHAELRTAAESLNRDLLRPRWRIDRGTLESYSSDVDRWLGVRVHEVTDREALSAAAVWLWREHERGRLPAFGRQSVRLDGRDFTVIWKNDEQRLAALVAGPLFRQRELIDPIAARIEHAIDEIQLATPTAQWLSGNNPDPSVVQLAATESGLPWNVSVRLRADDTATARVVLRRRLFAAGVALLLLVVAAAAYVTGRSMSRELAVARLQSDFVSAVSHEFRTPLTALKQFTDLLGADDDLPLAKRRWFYQAQARATSRLTHLVESLLDFGRMEAGAHPYRMMPLAVDDIVSEVVAEFRRDAAQSGFHIQYSADAAGERVIGDHDALARAVRNLLENAHKYSGAGRTIHVQVERRHKTIAISVRDEGPGIPLREQREIFKKLVRGSASRRLGIKGTGIGLAMVRHIVRAHRGRVIVESEPGRGSTFTIVLPADVVGAAAVLDNRTIPSGL